MPVVGKAFHHPSYPGTMSLAGGVPSGAHNQFIPLQVRAGKENVFFNSYFFFNIQNTTVDKNYVVITS